MDTGIRPTCAPDNDLMVSHLTERKLQALLHCSHSLLRLKTAEACSIVFDAQRYPHKRQPTRRERLFLIKTEAYQRAVPHTRIIDSQVKSALRHVAARPHLLRSPPEVCEPQHHPQVQYKPEPSLNYCLDLCCQILQLVFPHH
jgi:hypothetical protein